MFEDRFANAIRELQDLSNKYLSEGLEAAMGGNTEKATEILIKQHALTEAIRILHKNVVI